MGLLIRLAFAEAKERQDDVAAERRRDGRRWFREAVD
jgi:hypothetical protein